MIAEATPSSHSMSTWLRVVVKALEVSFFPFLIVMRFVEELSGEGRWYRRQRRRMQSERPPLSNPEFLHSVSAKPSDAALWVAVRRAIAESIGVPAEAIYPDDPIADIWRMQWCGPDLTSVWFRLENILWVRIIGHPILNRPLSKHDTDRFYGCTGDFQRLAENMVQLLNEVMRQPAD